MQDKKLLGDDAESAKNKIVASQPKNFDLSFNELTCDIQVKCGTKNTNINTAILYEIDRTTNMATIQCTSSRDKCRVKLSSVILPATMGMIDNEPRVQVQEK